MSWNDVLLGSLVEIKTGKLDANAAVESGAYPFFTCAKKESRIDNYSFDCDAILIAGNGDLNVKHYKGKFDAYQRTYVLTIKDEEKIYMQFLYYFLDKYVEKLREMSIGGVIKYIKLGMLTDAKIPLPPLETQKQIATVLEKADQLRKDCKLMEQELNSLAQSVFIDMFGDPVTNPKGWDVKNLGDVCNKITDGEHQNPKFVESGYPMVMAKNVQEYGVDLIETKKITLNDLKKFRKKCGAEKGDLLLVSRGATIGRCKEVDTAEEFALMGSVILMKPKKDVVSGAYLESIFRHPGLFSKLVKSSSASAQEAIYLKHVKDLQIPIPPNHMFEKLVEFNLSLDSMLIDLKKQSQEADAGFNALMQKAFKGNLKLEAVA